MLGRLLAPFAPEHQRHGWRAGLWVLFLLLAPAAYFVAGSLDRQTLSGGLRLVPPERALGLARQAAQRWGVDTRGWSNVISTTENELQNLADEPRFQALSTDERRFLPLAVVRVVFYDGKGQWVLVRLRPDGSLLGIQLAPESIRGPRAITEEEARQVARDSLRESLAPPASVPLDDAELLPGATPETRRFRWQLDVPRFPEAKVVFLADVKGDRPLAVSASHQVDRAALSARASRLNNVVFLVRNLVFLTLWGFGLYRFARRSMEREVAYGRLATVAVAVVVVNVIALVITPSLVLAGLPPERLVGALVMLVVAAGLLNIVVNAALISLTYAAAEGELREIYPGKLTSLDALLTGRLFSANVGRSVLFGMAAGGWALAAYVVAQPAFASNMPRVSTLSLLLAYAPRGWLALMLTEPITALAACVGGLVLPLMLANRRVAHRGWRRLVVILLSLVGSSAAGVDFGQPWTVWYVVLVAGLLLGSFWVGDFLAAIVAINMFAVSHAVLALSGTVGGWLGTGFLVMSCGLATMVFALAATYAGRWLGEAEVRPKYAERLMERLNLQAEVAAAREAQLRLLPTVLPQIPGVSVAASCTPAREVGGDFYDFFMLGRDRVGILVAEGGSTGLASALSIGLAKGFLLHAAAANWPPGESLRRLRPVLGGAVKGTIERLGLGYAILDPGAGQLRFARFGQHPVLFELAPGASPRLIEPLGVAEAEVVGERTVTLTPGSTLVLATDGLDARLRRRGASGLAQWLASRSLGETSAEGIQAELLLRAGARDADLDDDLTVVILHVHEAREAVREGVA